MKIETSYSLKEYQKLTMEMTYRRPAIIFISLMGIFLVFAAVFLFIVGATQSSTFVQFALGLFFLIGLPLITLSGATRNYKSHKSIHGKIIYDIRPEKIFISGDTFKSEVDWNKIYKIVELRDWILFYQSRQVANFVPKSSIGDKLPELRKLIQSKPEIRSRLRSD